MIDDHVGYETEDSSKATFELMSVTLCEHAHLMPICSC